MRSRTRSMLLIFIVYPDCCKLGSLVTLENCCPSDGECRCTAHTGATLSTDQILLQLKNAARLERTTKIVQQPATVSGKTPLEHASDSHAAAWSQQHETEGSEINAVKKTDHVLDTTLSHMDREAYIWNDQAVGMSNSGHAFTEAISLLSATMRTFAGKPTFNGLLPVFVLAALLGLLVILIVALAGVAVIAMQSDEPRQELPVVSEQFPEPRLLGRTFGDIEPSPRQLSSKKYDQVCRQTLPARHSNSHLAVARNSTVICSSGSSPRETSSRDERLLKSTPCLCPRLVVPDKMELVFIVPEVVQPKRQEITFSIEDLDGQPISKVVIDERPTSSRCGIYFQYLNGDPLAHVATAPLYVQPESGHLPSICYNNGEVHCKLERLSHGSPLTEYALRDLTGDQLFAFRGDFHEKKIYVSNRKGQLACVTKSCNGNVKDALESYYEVRIAERVDAALMLCALLAIDKVECSFSSIPCSRSL